MASPFIDFSKGETRRMRIDAMPNRTVGRGSNTRMLLGVMLCWSQSSPNWPVIEVCCVENMPLVCVRAVSDNVGVLFRLVCSRRVERGIIGASLSRERFPAR
jgi:hypothetical protein